MQGGHIPRGSAAGPRRAQAGGLRGARARGCRGGARVRGGSLAPALPGGGGGGTQAGEPETASQFIYKPVPTALPPARHTRRRRLLPPPRSHRPLPAAPASARTSRRERGAPRAERNPPPARLAGWGRIAAPRPAPPAPRPPRSPHPCAPRSPERQGRCSGRRAAGLPALPWAPGFPRAERRWGAKGREPGVGSPSASPAPLPTQCLRFLRKTQVAGLAQAGSTAKLPAPLGSWTAGARLPGPWASPASVSLGEARAGDLGRAPNPNPGFSLCS